MRNRILFLLVIVAVLVGLGWAGFLPKWKQQATLKTENDSALSAIAQVQVVQAGRVRDSLGITLPGRLEAKRTTGLFARAQGYVKAWYVDIGAKVHAGQVLAILAQPELEQDLAAAESNLQLAQSNLQRLQSVTVKGAISTAELDNAKAAVKTAKAQVARLKDLKGFQTIVAPFDGIVTDRNLEVGTYVTPGSTPLFTLNTNASLRVFVDVPQADVNKAQVKEGTATVQIPELRGQVFKAEITRNAGAYNPASRTLSVQLELKETKGLAPGMYAQVTFAPLASDQQAGLVLPANTVYPSVTGPMALVVNGQNKIEQRPLTIDKDYGSYLVVAAGVAAGEQLVVNPSSRLTEGLAVHILPPDTAQTQAPKAH